VTRRPPLALLLAAGAVLGCGGSTTSSIAVVKVRAPATMPAVTQLQVQVSNAGLSDTKYFPPFGSAEGIVFPTSFAVTFAASRSGTLGIVVRALDAAAQIVAAGSTSVEIVAGGRADATVDLVLVGGSDGGLPGPEGGAPDGPGGSDVLPWGPDARDAGGTGGKSGTGGAIATGGATASLPPGTGGAVSIGGGGGVVSTGGSTARASGGAGGALLPGTGGTMSGTGGRTGTGGAVVGTGGRTGTGGAVGAGGAVGGMGGTTSVSTAAEPCTPAKTVTGGQSGVFDTTGAFCFKTTDTINGWGCSSFDGRTVKVNGTTKTCGATPLPAKVNGYYYFDCSAGAYAYASIFWY